MVAELAQVVLLVVEVVGVGLMVEVVSNLTMFLQLGLSQERR